MARARTLGIGLAAALLVGSAAISAQTSAAAPSPKSKKQTVEVQLLAVNDFHGNLQPPTGSSGRIGTIDAGGAEYLATHVAALRATDPNTVVVSAGDLIGASPLLSALFHDEPTIEAFTGPAVTPPTPDTGPTTRAPTPSTTGTRTETETAQSASEG